ncbi:hypothetical protein [Leptospira stimsonii]|uniref:MarR family transcriptional regulator n=1 Tax=Leptospira stimsonii TaxID=2202203 RepID=A0A396YNM7_9LEPT|nr:hypothetical protein [Leptospira stimsonii]RHX84731.1 hypothetical protein DLM75_22210 [Leptospira stimsonii]
MRKSRLAFYEFYTEKAKDMFGEAKGSFLFDSRLSKIEVGILSLALLMKSKKEIKIQDVSDRTLDSPAFVFRYIQRLQRFGYVEINRSFEICQEQIRIVCSFYSVDIDSDLAVA